MFVTIVNVQVKPQNVQEFLRACEDNHMLSIQEPGNMRFDILQSQDDPAAFVLYEAYESQAAAAAHKETEHYRAWRDTVADWMAEPRKGTPYQGHYPAGMP